MTDQDALDRQCAEALGWKWEGCEIGPDLWTRKVIGVDYPDIELFSPTRIPAQAMALQKQAQLRVGPIVKQGVIVGWYAADRDDRHTEDDELEVAITRAFVAWLAVSPESPVES